MKGASNFQNDLMCMTLLGAHNNPVKAGREGAASTTARRKETRKEKVQVPCSSVPEGTDMMSSP